MLIVLALKEGVPPVTPLVLILANYALGMIKADHEPLHTLICAIECIWTIETAKIWLSVEIQ